MTTRSYCSDRRLQRGLERVRHQQFRRVRRQLAGGEEIEVGHHLAVHGLLHRQAARDQLGQAAVALQAEVLVRVAAAQVGVDQQRALAGGGHQGGEVRRHEALADARRGAGDQHAVVGRLQHRELHRRAQAAQAFHGRIVRVLDREQANAGGAAEAALGNGGLRRAQRNGRENRQAGVGLDLVRIAQALLDEGVADEGGNDAEEQPQRQRGGHDAPCGSA